MRSGEVLPLCADQLNRTGIIWVYRPAKHKTAHRNKRRVISFGPRAQEVLMQFIRIRCPLCGVEGRPPRIGSQNGCLCGPCADHAEENSIVGPWPRIEVDTDRPLFSPIDEQTERYENLRAKRKTRVQPSQENRKKPLPSRSPGLTYRPTNYGNAVRRACLKAGVKPWHPHQLRHTFGTLARQVCGLEGAAAAQGHAKTDTTEIYAEKNLHLAAEVARRIG
jgi:integrase